MNQTTILHHRMYRAGLALLVLATLFFPLGVLEPHVEAGSPAVTTPALRRAGLMQTYRTLIASHSDLETFARLAESAAGFSGEDVERFVDDLSFVILGSANSLQGLVYSPLARLADSLTRCLGWGRAYPALLRFGGEGFRFDDRSNQVQHFWFAVVAAYNLGARLADLQARYHEWNAPGLLNLLPLTGHGEGSAGDLALSRQGIWLGRALAEGRIQPAQVGAWLRDNL